MIVGGGLASGCTITAVSGSGPYVVATSQTIPAGTGVIFAGGPSGAWLGAGAPIATNEMSLTLTAGSPPQAGDVIVGGGLEQPLTVTGVSGTGPYTVSTSQAIPAGGTFAGGPSGAWIASASPIGGTNQMSLAFTGWPLTLGNVSELYRYAALAQLLGMGVTDFLTLKSLAGSALDQFGSPDTTTAFVALAKQLQRSNFTAPQLAYLYQGTSTPPGGLAPQSTTLLVLAQAVRNGLAQIAAQCAIVPDPKGTLTASTVTQLVSKTVAAQTVALINGTAAYTTQLETLPLISAWSGTASPPGGGNQISLTLSIGSAPQAGDATVGGGESFTVAGRLDRRVRAHGLAGRSGGPTFAGAPSSAWMGTASPSGTDQIELSLTAGPPPAAGDTIVADELVRSRAR